MGVELARYVLAASCAMFVAVSGGGGPAAWPHASNGGTLVPGDQIATSSTKHAMHLHSNARSSWLSRFLLADPQACNCCLTRADERNPKGPAST
jgi:hypothetical protein